LLFVLLFVAVVFLFPHILQMFYSAFGKSEAAPAR